MHAPRFGVDISGQRVGIGALELGQQPPFQHLHRELVALCGKLFQCPGVGAPGAGLGAPSAGQAHLVEQDFAELFWRADIKVFACQLFDLVFEPRDGLGKGAGEAGQCGAVNLDASALHLGQHGRQRALQCLVDRSDGLGRQARFQFYPKSQGDIGLFARIFRGAIDGDVVKAHR